MIRGTKDQSKAVPRSQRSKEARMMQKGMRKPWRSLLMRRGRMKKSILISKLARMLTYSNSILMDAQALATPTLMRHSLHSRRASPTIPRRPLTALARIKTPTRPSTQMISCCLRSTTRIQLDSLLNRPRLPVNLISKGSRGSRTDNIRRIKSPI
jgi:hypothetical protein